MLSPARALKTSRVMRKIGSVKSALEKIDADVKLHHYKIRNFRPNVSFTIEKGHYIIKTAENGAELEECLKLRFNVFHKEYMNKKRNYGVDIDKLDDFCDHLVIFDKRIEKTIGTYRLNSSLFSNTFYSSSEFDLGELTKLEGNKLELGRACIAKEYRTGVVIAMLWRGISEYIKRTETRLLLGCSSIKTMEPLEIGLITKHFADSGDLTYRFGVQPTKKYQVKQLKRVLEYLEMNPFEYNKKDVEAMIPPLVHSYIRMGAMICGEPAIDREFHCIDLLTVVKMDEMLPEFKEKYGLV